MEVYGRPGYRGGRIATADVVGHPSPEGKEPGHGWWWASMLSPVVC